jgi:quinol monooxygenase YgiN
VLDQFVLTDWVAWGDLTAGDTVDPYFFVIVRGTLKASDLAESKAAHDEGAAAGKDQAIAAGDVAHIPYLGKNDPTSYVAIDVWKSSTNIEAFYSDPAFQAAAAVVLQAPPAITVYQSTDWYQW